MIQAHNYVGVMFLASSIGHAVMIAAIAVGRVMKPAGRLLVCLYLALNAAIAFVISMRLFERTRIDAEVVVLGVFLSTAYVVLTLCLAVYGVVRALQQRS